MAKWFELNWIRNSETWTDCRKRTKKRGPTTCDQFNQWMLKWRSEMRVWNKNIQIVYWTWNERKTDLNTFQNYWLCAVQNERNCEQICCCSFIHSFFANKNQFVSRSLIVIPFVVPFISSFITSWNDFFSRAVVAVAVLFCVDFSLWSPRAKSCDKIKHWTQTATNEKETPDIHEEEEENSPLIFMLSYNSASFTKNRKSMRDT